MSYDTYHKRNVGKHMHQGEMQMMGYGFDPSLSEGSLKPPIFLTSGTSFSRPRTDMRTSSAYTSGDLLEPIAGQSLGS